MTFNTHDIDTHQRLESILNSDKISEDNKEDIKQFYNHLEDRKHRSGKDDISDSRIASYLSSLKVILEHEDEDLRLKNADEEKLRYLRGQINKSAYYPPGYKPQSKKEKKKVLAIYIKWFEKGDTGPRIERPDKVNFINLHVEESVKDRVNPVDLARPSDMKELLKQLSMRDRAIILTHWDLATRINETLRTKIKDFFIEDGKAKINVRVKKTGTSKSQRRVARIKIARPAIERWLEEGHPNPDDDDAYLFCSRNPDSVSDDLSERQKDKRKARTEVKYDSFTRALNRAFKKADTDFDHTTHNIRRSRITFLKGTLGIEEANVDKRVGHVPGSEVTRAYTRISDDSANDAYAEAYGEEVESRKLDTDLLPKHCQNKDCQQINPGYRDICYECKTFLESEPLEANKPVEEVKALVIEKLEEDGMLEEVMKEI